MNHRSNSPRFVNVWIRSGTVGPGVHPDRQHSRQVGISLGNGRSWLEPCDSVEPEARENRLAPVERQWRSQIEIRINKSKSLWHYTHDFPCLRINHDVASKYPPISAEPPLPIPVAQHYPTRTVRHLIDLREPTPNRRRHTKRLEYAIAHSNRAHLFRLGHARDVRRTSDPHA